MAGRVTGVCIKESRLKVATNSAQVVLQRQPGVLEEAALRTQKHSIKNVQLTNVFQPNPGLGFVQKKFFFFLNVPMMFP